MTVAIDFDGVIHDYTEGWQDGTIYGQPVDAALWALTVLMYREPVFVFTSRKPSQVARWIECESGYTIECTTHRPRTWYGRLKPFWDELHGVLVTNHKYPARIYIDDRAYKFTEWNEELFKVLNIH